MMVAENEGHAEHPPAVDGAEAINGGGSETVQSGPEVVREELEAAADEKRDESDDGPHEGDHEPVLVDEPDDALTDADVRRGLREIRALRTAAFGGGDAVGGDKVTNRFQFFATDAGRTWRVHDYAVEDVQAQLVRFAGTPSRQALADLLRDNRVAVLRGCRKGGRKTTALAALHLRCDGVSVIHSERVPADLTAQDITAGRGYIFDASGAGWADRVDEPALLGCQDVLRKVDARLVVIVSDGSVTDDVRSLTVDHEQADTVDVLRQHLRAELPDDMVQNILAVMENEKRPETPLDAADLARALCAGAAQGRSVRDVLATRPDPLRQRARELLWQRRDAQDEAMKDLGRRSFIISWAVLSGLSVVHICRAAQALAERLFAIESPDVHAELSQLPFGDSLTGWVGYARTELLTDSDERDRRLLVDEAFADAVLKVVWLDYVVAHEALLSWLKELAGNSDGNVRFKAALALGRLAVCDFDFIKQDCFIPWSQTYNGTLHQAAAWALEVVFLQDPARKDRVLALASDWVRGSLPRRSVAARLYGTNVGAKDPANAMRGLHRIAGRGTGQLDRLVVRSVVELFAGGHGPVVADALTVWAGSPHPGVRSVAAECLAGLAREDDAGRPVLMLLFDDMPERITEMWRRMLLSRVSRRKAWGVLRAWEKDKVDFSALRIRLELDERLRPALRFYLGPHLEHGKPQHGQPIHGT